MGHEARLKPTRAGDGPRVCSDQQNAGVGVKPRGNRAYGTPADNRTAGLGGDTVPELLYPAPRTFS